MSHILLRSPSKTAFLGRPDGLGRPSYVMILLCAVGIGCSSGGGHKPPQEAPIPRELQMTTLPPYQVAPSDILLITTMNVVPKPPYRVQPLDALFVQTSGIPLEGGGEIRGLFPIEPGGTINLGLGYGTVQVAGLTIDEVQDVVQKHMAKALKGLFRVQVALGQSRAMQQINGIHLVRQDGTLSVGVYGSVYLAGMTLDQARQAIEQHLSQYVLNPEIALDVYSYNTKWYYVIQDRAGYGQMVIRLPITGHDTVLDAISYVYGTYFLASNRHMWLSRPNGEDPYKFQVFPVNWPAIVKGGSPATNYQLFPGDRLYVQSNPLIALNNRLIQLWAPIMTTFNNAFGLTVLGSSTVGSIEGVALEFRNGASSVVAPGVGTTGVLR
jgi:polysaccharide biosynthesis/export protein